MKKKIFFKILLIAAVQMACTKQQENAQKEKVSVIKLAKTTKSWDGSLLPAYSRGQPEITILKITIAPHTALPMHKHPFINAGVLTKGKLTVVTKNNQILHLKAGDSIVEVVEQWHHGKNETNETCEIIVFYAGIEGKAITIKE